MVKKEEVIVLSSVLYKEKKLILKTLSKQEGIKTFFLNRGSGKSKKYKSSNYQVLSILEIISKSSSNSGMPTITESKHLHLLIGLRSDAIKNALSFLLAETLSKCIQEETANLPLYQFIENNVLLLDQDQKPHANFHLYFISHLTKYLGIAPISTRNDKAFFDLKEGHFTSEMPDHPLHLNTEESEFFQDFMFSSWEQVKYIKLSGAKRSLLLTQLLKYYQYHLPGFELPKSLEVLNEVFS